MNKNRIRGLRWRANEPIIAKPISIKLTVNHDRLMAAVAKRVADQRMLKLIRAFRKAGVMEDGVAGWTLSPMPILTTI